MEGSLEGATSQRQAGMGSLGGGAAWAGAGALQGQAIEDKGSTDKGHVCGGTQAGEHHPLVHILQQLLEPHPPVLCPRLLDS